MKMRTWLSISIAQWSLFIFIYLLECFHYRLVLLIWMFIFIWNYSLHIHVHGYVENSNRSVNVIYKSSILIFQASPQATFELQPFKMQIKEVVSNNTYIYLKYEVTRIMNKVISVVADNEQFNDEDGTWSLLNPLDV